MKLLSWWKPFLVLFIAVLSLQGAMAGAPMPARVNGGQPIILVVDGLPNLTDANNISAKANMAVAFEFMKRYPNVTLKPFSFLEVPGSGGEGGSSIAADTNALMSMAAGTAPDVFKTNFRQSDTFIRQGFLLPLDEYFDAWKKAPGGLEEINTAFPIPVLKEVAIRRGPDDKVHVYAIPPDMIAMIMMYTKSTLREADCGEYLEHPPETWDQFYQLCLKVTDPRKDRWGYTLQGTWFLSWMLWSMGNDILVPTDVKKTDWVAGYDDDHAVSAFQFAWKLVNGPWAICPECEKHFEIADDTDDRGSVACPRCKTAFTIAELKQQKLFFKGVCTEDFSKFYQGKIACFISYMGSMVVTSGLDTNQLLFARVPKAPNGRSVGEVNSYMYAINGTLKDRGKIDTAWAYIRFQCSDEAKRIKTKVFVDGGYAKFLNPAWLKKFGYDSYLREVPPGWINTFESALRDGCPEPYGKNAQQIYNEMDIAWGQVRQLPTSGHDGIRQILHANVIRTNERLMGKVRAGEKRKRDGWALGVVLVSLLVFALLMRYTMATYGQALRSDAQRSRAARRQVLIAWSIMLPALAAVIVFQYLPLGFGSAIAFQDYQVLLGGKWIGLANFGQVLFAPEFWRALFLSIEFAVLSLGLGFLTPVILALLLNEIPRGSLFFRIVYFLPSVTSGIVVMLLWTQLYTPSPYGPLNQFLAFLHIPEQKFLQDPMLAIFWVIVPVVWMAIGPGSIIYLAALQQIPAEYYEAADVDGAGFFAKLRAIVIPYLKPLLIINFVGACVGAMKSFEPILVMTGGGPAGTTKVLGLELWQTAFMYLRYGYATAMGWILASLLIGFTMFQLRYLSKVQFRLVKSD